MGSYMLVVAVDIGLLVFTLRADGSYRNIETLRVETGVVTALSLTDNGLLVATRDPAAGAVLFFYDFDPDKMFSYDPLFAGERGPWQPVVVVVVVLLEGWKVRGGGCFGGGG